MSGELFKNEPFLEKVEILTALNSSCSLDELLTIKQLVKKGEIKKMIEKEKQKRNERKRVLQKIDSSIAPNGQFHRQGA